MTDAEAAEWRDAQLSLSVNGGAGSQITGLVRMTDRMVSTERGAGPTLLLFLEEELHRARVWTVVWSLLSSTPTLTRPEQQLLPHL